MELVLVTGNGSGMTVVMGHWEWGTGCWLLGSGCCTLGRTPGSKPLVAPWPHPGGLGGAWPGAASLTSSLVSSGAARLPWHRYWHRAGLRVPAPWHPCHCQCIPVGSSMSQWVPADPSRHQWVPLGPSRPWCMQMIPVCSKVHSSPSYWGSQ